MKARSLVIATLPVLMVAGWPASAYQLKVLPECHQEFGFETTSATESSGEVRRRLDSSYDAEPVEGRYTFKLAPQDGANPEYAQTATVEFVHLRANPEEPSQFKASKPGYQKIRFTLEKTVGTTNRGNPYVVRLSSGRSQYGLEPLSSRRNVLFVTEQYGLTDLDMSMMDLGKFMRRRLTDLTITLEHKDGTVLATWTAASADINAGNSAMNNAYKTMEASECRGKISVAY